MARLHCSPVFCAVIFRWVKRDGRLARGFAGWVHNDRLEADRIRRDVFGQKRRRAELVFKTSPPGRRSHEQLEELCEWARMTDALREIGAVVCQKLLQRVDLRELSAGEPLFLQGDPPDAYYVILSGTLALSMFQDRNEAKAAQKRYRVLNSHTLIMTKELLVEGALGVSVATLTSGAGLGELSLLGIGNISRACAAVASSPTLMLKVEPGLYLELLRAEHLRILRIQDKSSVLTKMGAFCHWHSAEKTNLAYKMVQRNYVRGEIVLAAGAPVSELIVVREGLVTLLHPRGGVALASLGEGEMVGAEALIRRLTAPPRRLGSGAANTADSQSRWTVVAATDAKCYCASLDDVVRNCSGGAGVKTQKILQELIALQDERRRGDFKKQRKLRTADTERRRAALAREATVQHFRANLPPPRRSSKESIPIPPTQPEKPLRVACASAKLRPANKKNFLPVRGHSLPELHVSVGWNVYRPLPVRGDVGAEIKRVAIELSKIKVRRKFFSEKKTRQLPAANPSSLPSW